MTPWNCVCVYVFVFMCLYVCVWPVLCSAARQQPVWLPETVYVCVCVCARVCLFMCGQYFAALLVNNPYYSLKLCVHMCVCMYVFVCVCGQYFAALLVNNPYYSLKLQKLFGNNLFGSVAAFLFRCVCVSVCLSVCLRACVHVCVCIVRQQSLRLDGRIFVQAQFLKSRVYSDFTAVDAAASANFSRNFFGRICVQTEFLKGQFDTQFATLNDYKSDFWKKKSQQSLEISTETVETSVSLFEQRLKRDCWDFSQSLQSLEETDCSKRLTVLNSLFDWVATTDST